MGRIKIVLKMQVQDAPGTQMDAMYFGDVEAFLEFLEKVWKACGRWSASGTEKQS